MAHHDCENCCHYWFCTRLCHPKSCSAIRVHDRIQHWHVCCEQHHLGMGWHYLWADKGEKSCVNFYGCQHRQHQFYLDSGKSSSSFHCLAYLLIQSQYLWPSSDGPRYVVALGSSAAFSFATMGAAWVMKLILMRQNKRLRATGNDIVLYAY